MSRWQRFWMVWGVLMVASLIWGQQPAKNAPTIPDSLLARFWKAQTQSQQAQAAAAQAQAQMAGVVKEMQEACGPEFQPAMDSKGDPACVAKPKPEAKK